jgi:integration host factor subunit beta
LSRPKIIKQLKVKNPNLSRSDLEIIIDTICQNINLSLKKGEKIELRGFGTFFIKKIKEKHSARNPKTEELIYIPEKNKVRFKASKFLKKFINE